MIKEIGVKTTNPSLIGFTLCLAGFKFYNMYAYENLSLEDMDGEIWKPITMYNGMYIGLYEVSNMGRIKSLYVFGRKGERIMKQMVTKTGYLVLSLIILNKSNKRSTHRLVANEFIEIKYTTETVNHKDLDKKNNKVENLEWLTHIENTAHAVRNGKMGCPPLKPVFQYDLNGDFIKEWPSATDIRDTLGLSLASLSMCCNKGSRKSCGGFKWKFKPPVSVVALVADSVALAVAE